MSRTSKYRGHKTRWVRGDWCYVDTGKPIATGRLLVAAGELTADRPCGRCGLNRTKEGHDGCLGTLPGPVAEACCGHGTPDMAYISYRNHSRLAGVDAMRVFKELGVGSDGYDDAEYKLRLKVRPPTFGEPGA